MDDIVFNSVLAFVDDVMFKYDFALNRDTDIRKDLKIRGHDAVEFLLAYAKQFNVDLSNFMADEYIEDEGVNLIFPGNKKPLTLNHLEKGIIIGKLDRETIESI
jgi:hypothetical protein